MTGKEANMNIDTLFRVKNEPFEPPFDIYSMDCRNSCYSAFTDLSNWRSFGCTECNDRIDYECSSCMCQICFHKTSAEKRYRCFQCHKVFHEWCRTNREMASSTGRWLCLKCKDLENRHSSFFRPCIKEVITKVPDGKSRMVVIKSEKFDLNSNSTVNESLEVDPVLENSLIQAKNKIVERVAKSFMRKMNNAARNKICVIVPSNHFGPIPGILVGTCWKYRLQVSESGVHRPLVAGIHGRENEGAYSIVLSGVYAEDQDNGDVFYYSGCGGRDKDPTKRCSAQVQDQKLTRYNKALAVSCNAPLNDEIGAEAVDWRAGKPVRVIRNYKLKKHSIYAPEEGNRYDGIYKVVKYFPTVGKAGLLVWRYFLRRDDPEPAPWTEAGKRIIEEKNLRVIWPDESENEDTFSTSINEEIERPIKKQRPYNDNNYQFPDMNAFDVKYIKSEMGLPTPILDLRLTTDNLDDTSVDIKPDINLLQLSLQQGAHARVSPYSSFSGSYTVSSAPTESVPMFKITVASVKSVNSNHFISSNAQNVANGKNFVRDGDRDSRALDSRHSAAGDIRVSVTPGSKNLTASGNNVSRIFDSKDPAPGDNKVLGTPDIKDLPAGSNKVSGTPNSKDPAAGGNKVSGIPDIKDPASGSNKITRTPKIKDPATGSSKVLGTLDNKDPAAGDNKVSGIPDNRIPAVDGIKVLGTSDGKNPAAGDIEISRIFDCKSSAADNEKISWTPDKRNNFATVDNRVSGTPESLKNISPMSLISIKEEKGGHELPENVKKFMEMDTFNKTVWDFCGTYLRRSEVEFLNIVKLMFTCRYCCKLVDCPVTTPCDHNVCLECITNHFSKKLYSCPDCHYYLGPLFRIKENINLANALESLFPGYNLKLSKLI